VREAVAVTAAPVYGGHRGVGSDRPVNAGTAGDRDTRPAFTAIQALTAGSAGDRDARPAFTAIYAVNAGTAAKLPWLPALTGRSRSGAAHRTHPSTPQLP
jgi:hypothetical protein